MAKISLIRLSSPMADGRFRIYVRLTHRHGKAQRKTDFTCEARDTDRKGTVTSMRIISQVYPAFLGEWEERLTGAEKSGLAETMTASELLDYLSGPKIAGLPDIRKIDFLQFIREHFDRCDAEGRRNSGYNFKCVENSLREYSGRDVVMVSELTTVFVNGFIDFLSRDHPVSYVNHGKKLELRRAGLKAKSLNGRIRDFKTLFNALKRKYCDPLTGEEYIRTNPFRFWKPLLVTNGGGYRATDAEVLRTMNGLRGDGRPDGLERLAIDMFLLSFCLLGINATDLYDLTNSDLKDGRIGYNRNKTKGRRADGAFISIEVPPLAAEIMKRHPGLNGLKLLDVGEKYANADNLTRAVNKGLKRLCERNMGIPRLTYYSARHTWATIARNDCGVSREDIDLALNHTSEGLKMADVYVKKDFSANDRNNRKVMEFVFG